jgi:hypothetical protein
MAKALRSYLAELDSDVRGYRSTVNRVFSRKLTLPRHCARYFFEVLVETSHLYGDYLTLRELEPTILTKPTPDKRTRTRSSADGESRIRERLTERLESLACWSGFHPRNEFVAENQLRTQADYIACLVLHLPEIYSETATLESCIRQASNGRGFTDSCLAELLVGLEHAAHHASYCRHALEILSYEDSWKSSWSLKRPA